MAWSGDQVCKKDWIKQSVNGNFRILGVARYRWCVAWQSRSSKSLARCASQGQAETEPKAAAAMNFRFCRGSPKTSRNSCFLKLRYEVRVHHHPIVVTLLKVVEDASEDLQIENIRVSIRNHVQIIVDRMRPIICP